MGKKNDINIYILSGIIVFVILIIVIIYSLVTNIGDDNEVNILEEVDYKSRSIEAYTNIANMHSVWYGKRYLEFYS